MASLREKACQRLMAIEETGLELERVGPASDPLRRQDRRAGATEGIEHDVAAAGAVLHGICNQRDRFDRSSRRPARKVLTPAHR
jgi:hypothetical protein